ncbi:MAG: STAS domain-containing protein [Pyrinomonadaceae bacterium]|nr:STAS domain-containing protein [Acidobacteriota bacterium]MDQ3753505.1 STAS domain-containing protein [Acidobacteriota bacterium]
MADNSTAQVDASRYVAELLAERREEILNLWIKERLESDEFRDELISKKLLRQQSQQILEMAANAIRESAGAGFDHAAFDELRQFLNEISYNRAIKGYTLVENATYITALRNVLRPMIVKDLSGDPEALVRELSYMADTVDRMSLVMIENFIRSREEIIRQQRADMLELSTPVIKVWDKILTLPIIGTLDSRRAQMMMEALLQRIVDSGSTVAILDITGVRTMDTLVANHLIKTVTAARLMGARCILTGVSPAIAQTMVQLGIDLSQITTRAQMSDGIKLALEMVGRTIIPVGALTHLRGGAAHSGEAMAASGVMPDGKSRD